MIMRHSEMSNLTVLYFLGVFVLTISVLGQVIMYMHNHIIC